MVMRFLFLLLLWSGGAVAGEVRVAVAANFVSTFERIAKEFSAASGHEVVTSLGSSGTLYAQIVNGAPYELFFSADALRPPQLVEEGRAVAGTVKTYAIGRLALWSREPGRIDSEGAYLKRGGGRIAIANPVIAPYGLAAQQTLERLGLWQRYQPRLVRGQNIAQAFQFAASGSVDAAFVALSQIKSGEYAGRGSYWLVPQPLHEPVEQQMVLLERGRDSPAAKSLLEFMVTGPVRQILTEDGYLLPR